MAGVTKVWTGAAEYCWVGMPWGPADMGVAGFGCWTFGSSGAPEGGILRELDCGDTDV